MDNQSYEMKKVTEWIRKQNPTIYLLLKRNTFLKQRQTQNKAEGMEKNLLCIK